MGLDPLDEETEGAALSAPCGAVVAGNRGADTHLAFRDLSPCEEDAERLPRSDARILLRNTDSSNLVVGRYEMVLAVRREYMGRCPKVCGCEVSRLGLPNIDRLIANDKDFSLCSK